MSGKHSPNVPEALCISTSLVAMTALSMYLRTFQRLINTTLYQSRGSS